MGWKNIEDKRAYNRDYRRASRQWFRARGLCAECDQEDAYTIAGRYRCFECAAKRRKTPIEYIKPATPQKENFRLDRSRCYLCGAPVIDGESAWSGKPLRVCREHYEFMKRIAAKGRDTYRERHGETWGNRQYKLSQKKKKCDNSEKSLLPYTSYGKCATPFL